MSDQLSADVVVIGSGICGSLAALKLVKQGASVLILEAGGAIDRGRIVAAFRNSTRKSDWMSPYTCSEWAPHPVYKPVDNGYLIQAGPYPYPAEYIRGVGGTRALGSSGLACGARRYAHSQFVWGRRRLAADVRGTRPFLSGSGRNLGVSGAENTGSPRSKPFPMEPVTEPYAMRRIRERLAPTYAVVGNTTARNSRSYDGRPACCGNNSCQPICPIDAQYHGGIAIQSAVDAGAKLQINAVVYRIEHDDSGKIVAVHYYDPDKKTHRVTGKTFILAANGIESPKLLLISASDKYPNGLANSSGMVGRHLMDHPSTSVTFDADEELWLGRGPQSPSSINTMRDGAFRKEHAPYRLDFTNISRVNSATDALIASGVYGPEFEKQLRHRAAFEISLKDVLEVLPNPENRITLSSQKDALGIPKPEAHYSIDDYTRRGAQASHKDFARIVELMGGTNVRYSAEGNFANNQHITGTMSMGNDPKTSVCDSFGRTHDHENLFICSTGVMPTAATMNSTLTGVALALRTAHHIMPDRIIARVSPFGSSIEQVRG